MNADHKKTWHGRLIVALILLFGAAYSIYTSWPRTLPPLPLNIISERVIFDDGDCGMANGFGHMSLCPDGRHLLFLRYDWIEPNVSYYEPFLLDLGTGEKTKLPFPPFETQTLVFNMYRFSSDGNYIHAVELAEDDPGSYRPFVLLYDIRNRTLRTITVGSFSKVLRDDHGDNLLLATVAEKEPAKYRSAVIPMSDGPTKRHPNNGTGFVLSPKQPVFHPTIIDPSIVDLSTGKTLKTFHLLVPLDRFHELPVPFRTTDNRFFCYSDEYWEFNRVVQARNRIAERLPFVRRSSDSEFELIKLCCFWDSARNRLTTLRGLFPLAPGPSAGSVVLVDDSRPRNLSVLDLAGGQEYRAQTHATGETVCAYGKYVVYAVEKPEGGKTFVLVAIALPGGLK